MAKTVCVKVYNFAAKCHHIFPSKLLCNNAIFSLTITFNSFQNGVKDTDVKTKYLLSQGQEHTA